MRRILGVGVVAVLVLAACGGGSKSNTSNAGSGGQQAGGTPVTINTASVPKIGTVLVDAQGRTLYHETSGNFACTGSCTSTWPPLLVPSGGHPVAGGGVTGTLSSAKRPDSGTQVTYMGLTLYTFAGDTKSGEANGQGFGGVWFAMTPTGLSGGKGSKSSGSGGGRYGGGNGSGSGSTSSGGGYGGY
jgi:predicted lipoprotein with Yx(FWY)xxD motif